MATEYNATEADIEAAKFEEAIAATSFGKFNIFLIILVLPGTAAILFASTTMSFVMPSAECDLKLTVQQKGYLNAITYVGMIVSAVPWAIVADIRGRKIILIIAHIMDGIFVLCCSVSQEFYQLIIFKFLNGCCICGGYSALVTYMAELHSEKYRQRIILFIGFSITLASIVLPILAMIILPYRWEMNIGAFSLRSWNLYIAVVALPSLICGAGFIFFPESPKYLMQRKKYSDSEEIFAKIFSLNTGKKVEEFPVKLPVVPPTSVHNLPAEFWAGVKEGLSRLRLLISKIFILQIIFCSFVDAMVCMCQNTLRLWMPQLFALVRKFKFENAGSICPLLEKNLEEEQFVLKNPPNKKCFMDITADVFINNLTLGGVSVLCFLTAFIVIKRISPKYVLNFALFFVSIFGFCVYFTTTEAALTTVVALYLGFEHITSITAMNCCVSLFPTQIRTTVVSVVLMCGRIGSVSGNVLFPILVKTGCVAVVLWLSLASLFGFLVSLLIKNPLKVSFH